MNPDFIDPALGIPLGVILWLIWGAIELRAAATSKEK